MDVNKLILSNVSVEFPFRPYPCQVVYMEKVIQALQQASAARLLKIVEIYYKLSWIMWPHVHVHVVCFASIKILTISALRMSRPAFAY